jgi:hypothetical protein
MANLGAAIPAQAYLDPSTGVIKYLVGDQFYGGTVANQGGMGYVAGVGGAVTQITSKATGVTLNTITGAITTHNAALTTITTVSFVLTNNQIAATDVVAVNVKSGAVAAISYLVSVGAVAAGSCAINIYNTTAGTLSEALVLNFAVIKGAAS